MGPKPSTRKKRRKLTGPVFRDTGRRRGTVILNWRGTPLKEFLYIAEAFHDEAREAVKRLKRIRRFGLDGLPIDDFKAYPVIFFYRHALELSMKAVMLAADDMLSLRGKPRVGRDKLFASHDLKWLSGEVERVYEVFGWRWNADEVHFKSKSDFRGIIADLHKFDSGSYTFRYPVNTKGKASLRESFQFNLFHFADVMDIVMSMMAGAAMLAVDTYDAEIQRLGEAQEERMRYEQENYEPEERWDGE
jgi:hypothetical protein